MSGFRNAVFMLLLLCLAPAPVRAEGNIHAGQLKINPYVSVSETFDDNIFYTSSDEKKDSITTTTPGLRLQMPFRIHSASLEYYSVFNRYHRYKDENTTDYHGNGDVDLKFGSLFSLKLADTYVKGHEPRSSSSTGFIEIFHTNAAAVSAMYRLADLSSVELDYGKSNWRFKTSDFRNRDEDLVSGYFFYRFLRKTSAFIEFDHKQVAFTQPALDLDNSVNSLQLGLTWEISARSKGTVKGGTISKDFKSPALADFNGWTASADVHHDFTDNTSVFLSGQRIVNETNLLGSRYFLTTGAYAELTHRFVRRLSGVARASYGEDRYSDVIPPDTAVRLDRTTLGGVGLKYLVKDWLELALDYNRRGRRSDIPLNDYNEHAYVLTASGSW